MTISITDIQGLIAFAILNNKPAVIRSMNFRGYNITTSISDDDLFDKIWNIYVQNGLTPLQNVLSGVPIIKNTVTERQKAVLISTFQDPSSPTGKFGDWFNTAIQNVGDFLGGSTVSTTGPLSQTSDPALSATGIILIALAGLTGIVIFRKFKIVVIAIIIVLVAIILYGLLAKKTVTTGGGTVTTQHGGVGGSLFSGLFGLFGELFGKDE